MMILAFILTIFIISTIAFDTATPTMSGIIGLYDQFFFLKSLLLIYNEDADRTFQIFYYGFIFLLLIYIYVIFEKYKFFLIQKKSLQFKNKNRFKSRAQRYNKVQGQQVVIRPSGSNYVSSFSDGPNLPNPNEDWLTRLSRNIQELNSNIVEFFEQNKKIIIGGVVFIFVGTMVFFYIHKQSNANEHAFQNFVKFFEDSKFYNIFEYPQGFTRKRNMKYQSNLFNLLSSNNYYKDRNENVKNYLKILESQKNKKFLEQQVFFLNKINEGFLKMIIAESDRTYSFKALLNFQLEQYPLTLTIFLDEMSKQKIDVIKLLKDSPQDCYDQIDNYKDQDLVKKLLLSNHFLFFKFNLILEEKNIFEQKKRLKEFSNFLDLWLNQNEGYITKLNTKTISTFNTPTQYNEFSFYRLSFIDIFTLKKELCAELIELDNMLDNFIERKKFYKKMTLTNNINKVNPKFLDRMLSKNNKVDLKEFYNSQGQLLKQNDIRLLKLNINKKRQEIQKIILDINELLYLLPIESKQTEEIFLNVHNLLGSSPTAIENQIFDAIYPKSFISNYISLHNKSTTRNLINSANIKEGCYVFDNNYIKKNIDILIKQYIKFIDDSKLPEDNKISILYRSVLNDHIKDSVKLVDNLEKINNKFILNQKVDLNFLKNLVNDKNGKLTQHMEIQILLRHYLRLRLNNLIYNFYNDKDLKLDNIIEEFYKFKNCIEQCTSIQLEIYKSLNLNTIKATDLTNLSEFIKTDRISKINTFLCTNVNNAEENCQKIQFELKPKLLNLKSFSSFQENTGLNFFINEQEIQDQNNKTKLNLFYKELLIKQLIILDGEIETLQYLEFANWLKVSKYSK